MRPARLCLMAALAVAGCGGYPQPFNGKPGRLGARLALPPPPRLVVLPPTEALLPGPDSVLFATDLAAALSDKDVPAIAASSSRGEWRLKIDAELHETAPGPMVGITYTVLNPKGAAQGSTGAPPVSAQTWSLANPVALKLVAQRDAAAIAALLTRINAATQLSDPNSLVNRPPRIALKGVNGAPGDGDQMLAKNIATDLSSLGIVVQDTPQDADFDLAGTVTATPVAAAQMRLEITWTMHDPYGREIGHLLQMNDVPASAITSYWGDLAGVVAQEAAGGVKEVIANASGGRARQVTQPPSPSQAHATSQPPAEPQPRALAQPASSP